MKRRKRSTDRQRKRYRFIDLFCGAGGFSEGFRQAGFVPVFAVDIDGAAAATYEARFGHRVYRGPVERLRSLPVNADVVIGGPPCQGFSRLGRMSPAKHHKQLNGLWRQFLRILRLVRPKAFVLENVPEFFRSHEFRSFTRLAEELGYLIAWGILNAADYGVPQKRRRGLALGVRGVRPALPKPTGERATVRTAIGDLPLEPDGRNLHTGRNPRPISVRRYRYIPPGGNRFDLMRKRPDLTPRCWLNKPTGSTDVFGRMRWNEPAPTIRTEFFKPEKGRYLHPRAHRAITLREAARLQTFPDDYPFRGSKTQIARQIGNAVPPKLARAVAVTLRWLLSRPGRSSGRDRLNRKTHSGRG